MLIENTVVTEVVLNFNLLRSVPHQAAISKHWCRIIFSVINEDYSTTLQYLMRYPPVADAHSLIQYALHIKSPKVRLFFRKALNV